MTGWRVYPAVLRYGSAYTRLVLPDRRRAVMSERTSLTDEEIRTDVVQEIREETADADMDDTDADTDDTDSDADDTDV
jgi:hypothetical protein